MSLNIHWSSHLTGDAKDKFVQTVLNSDVVLNRLLTIVLQKEKAEEARRLSDKGYEDPNWAHKQADSVGYLRCLNEMKQLLDIKG